MFFFRGLQSPITCSSVFFTGTLFLDTFIQFLISNIYDWIKIATGPGGYPDVPLPINTPQLLLGGTKVFPGQSRFISPPESSLSASSSTFSATHTENLHREPSRRNPNWLSKSFKRTPFDLRSSSTAEQRP